MSRTIISLKDQLDIQLENVAHSDRFKQMVLTLYAEDYKQRLTEAVDQNIEDYYIRETIKSVINNYEGSVIKDNFSEDYDNLVTEMF